MTKRTLFHASVAAALGCLYALMVLSAVLSSGCAKAPPNLTPQAVHAFYRTQVIKDLDRLRDVAVSAHATVPPLLSAQETLAIVQWHRAAIVTIHNAPAGWKATVLTGLDETLANLSPKARETVSPYVGLVRAILQEIP